MLFWSTDVRAQVSLRLMTDNLPDLAYSTVAWGDYDEDGRLDLLFLGADENDIPHARVYRYLFDIDFVDEEPEIHETRYSLRAVLSPEVAEGAAAWGDYDADGDLDLVALGKTREGAPVTRLYENVGGGQLTPRGFLEGLYAGAAAWGDYDDDGDLDLLVCGIDESGSYRTILYRNERGSFSQQPSGLPDVGHCDLSWRDYDGDGDLDILLTGRLPSLVPVTRLYRNDGGGVFVDTGHDFEGLFFASVDWGDFDNDGDPDILISGGRLSPFLFDGVIKIYRNDGESFTDTGGFLRGGYYGSAAWGDYDNDGDLDILVSGGTHPFQTIGTDPLGSRFGTLYENDAGRFRPAQLPGALLFSFGGGMTGDAIWGDYDGDGDLDFMVVGQRGRGGGFANFTDVFRNELDEAGFRRNTPPLAPGELRAEQLAGAVRLSWSAASDVETPSAGLSYNVRVGTSPGGVDVISPMSLPSSGHRLIPAVGNAGQSLSLLLRGLNPGQYSWSVQAIDHGFRGSAFADEVIFTVGGHEAPGSGLRAAGSEPEAPSYQPRRASGSEP